MTGFILVICLAFCLASYTILLCPEVAAETASDPIALALLKRSSETAGRPWQRLASVTVDYEGNWSPLAKALQPVLVDAGFRQASSETYQPGETRVLQIHRGPAGEKRVRRTLTEVMVRRNGVTDNSTESREAAALVADAYIVFTFGSSVVYERGSCWQILGQGSLAGESCTLLAGTMRPGFGMSNADGVIAWIGNESSRLLRIQLTLNGLASTSGADVDVTFGDFRSGPDGTEWPHHFLERIRRPISAKAHEWRLTKLSIND